MATTLVAVAQPRLKKGGSLVNKYGAWFDILVFCRLFVNNFVDNFNNTLKFYFFNSLSGKVKGRIALLKK